MATRKTTREAETVLPATSPLPDIQVGLTQPYGPGFDYWELHAIATGMTHFHSVTEMSSHLGF